MSVSRCSRAACIRFVAPTWRRSATSMPATCSDLAGTDGSTDGSKYWFPQRRIRASVGSWASRHSRRRVSHITAKASSRFSTSATARARMLPCQRVAACTLAISTAAVSANAATRSLSTRTSESALKAGSRRSSWPSRFATASCRLWRNKVVSASIAAARSVGATVSL
eukprot:3544416-Pleurochrysis_carterae.AAC.2